jgi:tetratricopeptide (TPR) repeat protein
VGRDSPAFRTTLGKELARRDSFDAALGEFRRSVALRPTAAGWKGMADVHWDLGQWPQAARAYDKASALDPERVDLLYRAGLAWLRTGRPEQAEQRLAAAVGLAPDREFMAASLERARRVLKEREAAPVTEPEVVVPGS